MTMSARVARALERGREGWASTLAASAWEKAARVARPLTFGEGVRVITVGGATLGGSGKTPLALACAAWLAREGERVALVGHAYRARPLRARDVRPLDDASEVGDEALVASRALAPLGVPVVVAPSRQAALDHAGRLARVVVVDGVSQLSPRRAHLALLALDAPHPWGAGACPPRGDLRASRAALLASCDRVVLLEPRVAGGEAPRADPTWEGAGRPVDVAAVRSLGAWLGAELLRWPVLRALRVGLFTALARPQRVLAGLARNGVHPSVVVVGEDHAAPSRAALARAARPGVDVWLATPKCATRLPATLGAAPIATLMYELHLPGALQEGLRRAVRGDGRFKGDSATIGPGARLTVSLLPLYSSKG